jgi:hypothetical protein
MNTNPQPLDYDQLLGFDLLGPQPSAAIGTSWAGRRQEALDRAFLRMSGGGGGEVPPAKAGAAAAASDKGSSLLDRAFCRVGGEAPPLKAGTAVSASDTGLSLLERAFCRVGGGGEVPVSEKVTR